MRIVVLDGHTLNPGDNPWTALERLGEVAVHDRTPPEAVIERSRGAAILLTNKTRLAARHFEELSGLRFVGVMATGYDVVEIEAARRRGIPVSNVPEYGTETVAQHTVALLLELTNRVGLHDGAVHRGEWSSCPDFSFWKAAPVELAGLTMGLVGLGRIGRRVADLAHALGMRVIAASRSQTPEPPWPGSVWRTTPELFAEADVVSLHCPVTPETRGLVNGGLLARMRPTAFLVNTARGGLVDESALAAALEEGRLAGAAVDVAGVEPIRRDNPLLRAPRCILTPHMAWASLAARRRLMETTVRNVEAFLAGRPIHVVNG